MSQLSSHNLANLQEQIQFWQHSSELESGRKEVLKMAAQGASLRDTLQVLCEKAKLYNPELFCSVLSLDDADNTLHPIAAISIPDFYCTALEGVKIGLGVGSCGTSAFTRNRVIVEDINTHPYWTQYKELALSAGLQACWSEPIIGANGKVFGTFAIYYAQPKQPTEEDLQFIEVCANLAAVVYENDANKKQLMEANRQLAQTLDERTCELQNRIAELESALLVQDKDHDWALYSEKMHTTKSLLLGVAHEISTPIGVALTAISSADSNINNVLNAIKNKERLSKQLVLGRCEEIRTAVEMNYRSLLKVAELVNRFKDIDAENEETDIVSSFNIREFFTEITEALNSRMAQHRIELDVGSFNVKMSKGSLWQVIVELIDNSIMHGFKNKDRGLIAIGCSKVGDELVINYQDDGIGIEDEIGNKVFDPFFINSQSKKTLGLGLSVISNIVKQRLKDKICTVNGSVGARFEVRIPLFESIQ